MHDERLTVDACLVVFWFGSDQCESSSNLLTTVTGYVGLTGSDVLSNEKRCLETVERNFGLREGENMVMNKLF